MIVGERLAERIKAANISQTALARAVGAKQPTITRLINGGQYGSKYLHLIARELGTTPAYLSGETDDPHADAPPPPELNYEERAWVGYWRALDTEGRDVIVRMARILTGDRRREDVGAAHG